MGVGKHGQLTQDATNKVVAICATGRVPTVN